MFSNLAAGAPIDISGLDVRNIPLTRPDPPIESYDYLLSPRAMHLRLSAKCDSNCVYCERESWKRGDKEPERDMPVEIWEAVREKFLSGVEGVEVAGLGEPLLSKLFPQIAREVLAARKVLYFPTNGHFLNTKVTDCLGDGANVRVSVSLDAATEETYVKIGRGKPGELAKTVKAVQAFRKKCPKAFLHSQFTAGLYNIDEFPAFIDLAASMGIQEVTWRMVHAHTIPREDVSLRFAKDRTEKAIVAAQAAAGYHGMSLIIERRSYSAEFPNGHEEKDDPNGRLKRYMDFVPMSDPTCGGGTSGSGCTTITSTNTYGYDTTVICGTCTTLYEAAIFESGTGTSSGYVTQYVPACCNPACLGAGSCYVLPGHEFASTSNSTSWWVVNSSGVQVANNLTPNGWLVGVPPVSSASGNFYYSVCIPSGAAPGAGYDATGQAASNNNYNFINGFCVACFSAMSSAAPEIVRSVKIPRSQMSAMSVETEKPVQFADAAAIVWATGEITSCFAPHTIGDVHTDTLDSLIRNPRYQAFLQRRGGAQGGVLGEDWCRNCPRVF